LKFESGAGAPQSKDGLNRPSKGNESGFITIHSPDGQLMCADKTGVVLRE